MRALELNCLNSNNDGSFLAKIELRRKLPVSRCVGSPKGFVMKNLNTPKRFVGVLLLDWLGPFENMHALVVLNQVGPESEVQY